MFVSLCFKNDEVLLCQLRFLYNYLLLSVLSVFFCKLLIRRV